jgi:DNA polymerase sigma
LEEKHTTKRRRRRGKKENEKFNEVREQLFGRLVTRQIEGLVDDLGNQTNALYNHKIISFERVRTFVQSLYPMTNAVLFGSNAVGLSLPNSDVDILLACPNCYCKEMAVEMLAQIAVEINAMGWVVSCSTYLWAKVPIVKL